MAKKKKDDIEDNDDINKESQGELSEADDNFGLPDIEYEPINRDEDSNEDEIKDEEPAEEEVEPVEEEVEQPVAEEESAPEFTSEDDAFQHSSDQEEEPVYAQEEDTKTEYVPGSYVPPKDNSLMPKLIALVLIAAVAAVAIWYLAIYRPAQIAEKEAQLAKERVEKARQDSIAQAQAEAEKLAQLEAEREAKRLAEEAAKSKVGTVETISARTGRYYTVISSALDGDLAMDYAKKKSKQGVSTYILEAQSKGKFHRVALSDHGSWAEAQNAANDLKGEYGDGVWVIKF